MAAAQAVILGILTSIFGSMIWIFSLSRFTSKIAISQEISEDPQAPADAPVYRIKIVNRSRRAALDVRFQVALIVPVRMKGGMVDRRKPLPCGNPPLMIPRYRRSDSEGKNAYRLRVNADLRQLLKDEPSAHVRVQVFARHEVTGMGKVFEQQYHHPDSEIITGSFVKGQALTVAPEGNV